MINTRCHTDILAVNQNCHFQLFSIKWEYFLQRCICTSILVQPVIKSFNFVCNLTKIQPLKTTKLISPHIHGTKDLCLPINSVLMNYINQSHTRYLNGEREANIFYYHDISYNPYYNFGRKNLKQRQYEKSVIGPEKLRK